MVEISPQKPKLILPNWHWPLRSSLILFFASVGVLIFLKVYLSKIQNDIVNINNQIEAEVAKVNIDDENAVLRLNESLAAFSKITANHSYFSKFFNLLESLTYARVVFTKVDADKEKNIVGLKGTAQNYTALAKQMIALRDNENVKSLEVKGINFSTNALEFELTLGVTSNIFTKQP